MLYILYGRDDFSLQVMLQSIKAELGDPDRLAVSTTRLDGSGLTLGDLKNTCDALPFLSPSRLVVVEGLLERFETSPARPRGGRRTRGREGVLGEWVDAEAYVQGMPDSTVLVLVSGDVKRQNPLLKKLSPFATVRRFPVLVDRDLKSWIERRVAEERGVISAGAVETLVELVGGDLWAMSNEVQKLALHAEGRAINEEDVKQMVGYAQEASVFPLVDAIMEGKAEKAQKLLHDLYRQGAPAPYILTMIARQLRLVAQVKGLKRGLSYQEMRERLGLKPTYPVGGLMAQAKLYNLDRIRRAYDRLVQTDLAMKTGKYRDPLVAIELLIGELG